MRRAGARLGLWADQRGGWLMRDLACVPSRHTITYCDHTPDPAAAAFQPPGELRLGAAAGAAADAALVSAWFYAYALPEGDLAAEAGADTQQLLIYFGLLPDADSSAGGMRVLLVCTPAQHECSGGGGGKGGGRPIPMLAAAAGGGVAAIAAAAGCCWWWRRRRSRRGRAAALQGIVTDSASSGAGSVSSLKA